MPRVRYEKGYGASLPSLGVTPQISTCSPTRKLLEPLLLSFYGGFLKGMSDYNTAG